MLVFVMDQYDRPGHPTRRMDWVRKQVKRKWAKIVGGGISGKPAVLVLRERSFDRSKTVKRRFFAALDTGFLNVGYAVTELLADGTLGVLLKGTLNARTPDIRGLMDERRMYRRARRYHRRLNVKKKGQTPKSRPPRYESRGKRDSVRCGTAWRRTLISMPDSHVLHRCRTIKFGAASRVYLSICGRWPTGSREPDPAIRSPPWGRLPEKRCVHSLSAATVAALSAVVRSTCTIITCASGPNRDPIVPTTRSRSAITVMTTCMPD